MPEISLSGRQALVGGGSQGIGAAAARALAGRGASVTLIARDPQRLSAMLEQLPSDAGQRHRALSVDHGDTDALEREIAGVLADGRAFEIFVHNSGGPPGGPAHTAEPEAYVTAFRQHLIAGQVLVRALLPGMIDAGYGRIINVISTSVKEPIGGLGVSNTVRGAVANWSKTLSGELARFGITVNNVLPGYTLTERLGYVLEQKARKSGRPVEDIEREALDSVPLGRFAEPDEIACAIAFLASPGAAYITGVNLPVDGGRTGSL